jgi:Lipocalin-like domain
MSEIVISPSLALRAATAALAGLLSLPLAAQGQSLKDQIVGTWRLAAIYNDIGGNKEYLYGEKPMGLTMFDRSGNFLVFYSKPDLPKFAVANRLKGTDAENRAVIHGMISGYGTYTVDGDIVAMNYLASSYPNRAGTVEKRTYKIAGDELTIVNPTAAAGGTSYQTLIRVK